MRKVLALSLALLAGAAAFSQGTSGANPKKSINSPAPQQKKHIEASEYAEKSHLFITAGILGIYNSHGGTKSATSPVLFAPGIGYSFNMGWFSMEPRLNFFYTYYLWNDGMALPAEVENRTATVPAVLIDIPMMVRIQTKSKSFSLRAGGGLAILARYGILANGVSGDDPNRDDPGRTASEDVGDINGYFYKNLRWLYPELSGSMMFALSNGWQLGASLTLYIPLGSIISGDTFTDGAMLNLGIKMSY